MTQTPVETTEPEGPVAPFLSIECEAVVIRGDAPAETEEDQ